jgi:hypothetical protein
MDPGKMGCSWRLAQPQKEKSMAPIKNNKKSLKQPISLLGGYIWIMRTSPICG